MNQKILVVIMILMLVSTPVFAALGNYGPSEWTERDTKTEKIIGKFGFGAKNMLMGWSEILYHPYAAGNQGENIIEGAVVGMRYGLADTVGGILQFVTFPLAWDIQLPEGGTHMFKKPSV